MKLEERKENKEHKETIEKREREMKSIQHRGNGIIVW
jgi:hypothetical protein